MSEADDILAGLQRQSVAPAADVVAMINENPDQAVRALQLSRATGVAAPVIAGDLESFEAQHKAAAAGDIVRNNPFIAEYIRNNPLAAQVSNDDYGNLDQAAQTLGVLGRAREIAAAPRKIMGAAFAGAGEGFAEGFGEGGLGAWITPEDWVRAPLLASTMSVLAAPLEGIIRGGSGAIKAAATGVQRGGEQGYTSFGGDPADARRFGRDLAGIVEMQTTPGAAVHGPGAPPLAAKAAESIVKSADWIKSGYEPPRGIDPLVDQVKVERNRQELETLDQAVAEAQQSLTRERDPEMYAQFARQAIGEQRIGVSSDAVLALYGDKLPEPNDGILGWVPDIVEQIDQARATGADIHVPVADWVAKVDPALAKALHDDIRVRPGNITAREAALYPPQMPIELTTPFVGEPLPDRGVVPANMAPDGTIYVGKKDGMHFLLDEAYGKDIRKQFNLQPGDSTWKKIGFVTPDGEFLDRQQAFDWVNKNEKQIRQSENMEGIGLDALDYREQVPNARRKTRTITTGPLEGPIAQVRASSALEPLFSVGDRRLKIERLEQAKETIESRAADAELLRRDDELRAEEDAQWMAKSDGRDWTRLPVEARQEYIRKAQDSAERDVYSLGPWTPSELPPTPAQARQMQGFHDFKMVNELGQDVGVINLSERRGGKDLYVDYVQGVGGHGPRAFGPTLMRSILMQIKEQFPNAERIGGFRVSGARDAVGKIGDTWVRLDAPEGWGFVENANEFRRILEGGQWEAYSPSTNAYITPDPKRSAADRAIIKAVNEELDRIVPKDTAIKAADRIEMKDARRAGSEGFMEPSGVYIRYADTYPIILYSLEAPDVMSTARHEAIHHLRQYGFFKPEEWAILERTSKEQGWQEKFGINERYHTAGESLKLEESIADAYKFWADGRLENVPKEVVGLFERMKEFFEAIKRRIAEIIGKAEPTWEDIFAKVDSGEVGNREGNRPLDSRSFQRSSIERASIEDTPEGKAVRQDMINAAAAGLPLDTFRRLNRLIEKRNAEDIEAATKRIEREERRKQTKEWKEASAQLRPEVVEDIKARPDVAADLFLSSGELFGQKVGDAFRIRTDDLTPDQQAALPRYYQAKNGLAVEDVAHMFGFPSKDAFVERMSQFVAERGKTNASEYRRGLIDQELNRRLEARFGNLEQNIIDEARDAVLSETQIDLLAEEMHAVGLKAGQAPIDKGAVIRYAREEFEKQKLANATNETYMAAAFREGKAAETSLIKQDFVDAFQHLQKKFLATVLAREAKDLAKAQAGLDRTARVYLRREPPRAVEPAFGDHISRLLSQAGYRVRRSPEDLERSLEFHGEADLGAFTDRLQGDGWDPAVSEALKAAGAKPLDQMTVAEFREFKDAIDSLNHIGREIRKIEVAGEKADFDAFKREVLDRITQLPARSRESQQGRGLGRRLVRQLYRFDASLTRMEEMVKDLDLRETLGPLWDAVIRPMELSKTKEFDLMSELSEHFRKTKGEFGKKWRKSLGETLPNDVIFDPYSQSMYDMTRENLINIMLNWGNRSNIEKFVQGQAMARFKRRLTKEELPIYEGHIKRYIDQHARKEDWEFVQRMWEPFKGWQKEMDVVARNTSGVAPKWIDPEMVVTPHGNFEGGYWPVKYDQLGSGIGVVKDRANQGTDGIFGTDYFRAATSKGYLKDRTGYVDFVDISTSIEQAAATMQQTIHDIAYRDALMQGAKVFYDKDIRGAIRKHYGKEYEEQLIPWLKRISYQYATDDVSMKGFNDFLRRARINLVGHSLPLSLRVILSPDVGVPNPAAWARFEANRKENVALAMERSNEIRHMVYNMDRDYNDALNRLTAEFGPDNFRQKAVQWGYKPMMAVSQEFRMSTFVDKYYEALEQGRTENEAALIADSYVRERHGAASVADLPAALSSSEAMKMLTVFQGYFNTMYNWQRQVPGNIRRREWAKAGVNTLGSVVVGAAFGALLFNKQKEDDSWFKTIAKAIMIQPLSTVPILSHATQMYVEGFAPRLPFASLLSAAGSAMSDINKAFTGKKVEKPVQHMANVIGLSTGLPLAQIGRTGEFAYDIATGQQRPRNIGEWARGIITGEARLKK